MVKRLKKAFVAAISTILLIGNISSAFAATVSEFGDNSARTHYNGISDPQNWQQAADLTQFNYNGQTSAVTGNGTAMGQGSMLYLPISAANDSPTGAGYLTAWNMGAWNQTTGQPNQAWAAYVKGASNSSPLIVDGNVYVAGGGTLHGFYSNGTQIAYATGNIAASNYIYQNQVVSHPLYAGGLIWISSQNGYLFAVDPSTLAQVYAVSIGSRMDGSPTVVQSTTGTDYIAVGTASSANNQGGTGTLYIVSMDGKVVAHLDNPAGNGSPIASAPIWTGGGIAWNDIAGDVFWAQFDGSGFTSVHKWNSGAGGLITNEEAGYYGGYYILPRTTSEQTEVVNLNTPGSPMQFFTNADGQNNVGSPEISQNYVYVPDSMGDVNAFPVTSLSNPSGATDNIAFAMGFTSQNLTNADEQMLPAENGETLPTLAYLTSDGGLQIWQNVPAPSVSLTAADTTAGGSSSSTSVTAAVGDTVTFDAKALNVPKGDIITVSATKNTTPGTLQGSKNSVSSSPVPGFESTYDFKPTATSSTAQSVTYYAVVYNPSTGQTDSSQSNQVTVTWNASGTLTLTATPSSLATGGTATLNASFSGTLPSNAAIYIHDMTSTGSDHGIMANATGTDPNEYYEGALGSSTASTTVMDNAAETLEFRAAVYINGSYVYSTDAYVTWATSLTPGITASANPSSTTTGQSSVISYTTTDWQTGDYVTVTGSGTGASNVWNNSKDSNASDTYTETENPQNGATTTVNYTFTLYDQSGQKLAQATTTATWTSSIPTTTTLTFAANPLQLPVNNATTLSATVPPNPTGGAAPPNEYVGIYNQGTGQFISGAYTGSSNMTYGMSSNGETETYSIPYTSSVAGSQTFVAYLWPPGVTPYNNPSLLTSNSQTVTWVKPTVILSANPTSNFTGQASQESYSTVGMAPGDTVTVTSTGGVNGWFDSNDTNPTGSYAEIENPTGGGTVTVQITATMRDSSGNVLSTSTLTVTWQAPTITMNANPQSNLPGETSTISYSVNVALPSGYSVTITPSGTGASMWSATGLTAQSGSDKETENPAGGQTISVNYTGTVLSPSGQVLAIGTTSVDWVNAFNGSITLSGSPLFVPTGSPTTLTATTTAAVPSGWSLTIYDQTTGQMVDSSGSSPETTQYTSFAAETDTFIGYLNDGYENVGNPSNTVQVVWSQLALSANPTQLPSGSATTLTVSGQNVPSGDYLVIYNEGTGQTVGYSLSTPYSVSVSEPTPQTDDFVAYISSNTSNSGALISSNVVPVDWYGVNLVATPNNLPTGSTSTLTATAQNVPSGYELDIVDQTSGQIIAQSQPGQTSLSTTQTKSSVETDQYVANVVKPSNPVIPGLSMPVSYNLIGSISNLFGPAGIVYDSGNGDWYVSDTSGGVSVISGTSNSVLTTISTSSEMRGIAYDPQNGYIYAVGSNSNYTGYYSSEVYVINASKNQVVTTISLTSESPSTGIAYDSANGNLYVTNTGNAGAGTVSVISGTSNQVIDVISGLGWPSGITYDSTNGDLYITNKGNGSWGGNVIVVNGATNSIATTIGGFPGSPYGIAFDQGNGNIYETTDGSNVVYVINGSTNQIAATINTPSRDYAIGYDTGSGNILVADNNNEVDVINGTQIINTISGISLPGQYGPYGIASGNNSIYVSDYSSYFFGSITVIGMNEKVVTTNPGSYTTSLVATYGPEHITGTTGSISGPWNISDLNLSLSYTSTDMPSDTGNWSITNNNNGQILTASGISGPSFEFYYYGGQTSLTSPGSNTAYYYIHVLINSGYTGSAYGYNDIFYVYLNSYTPPTTTETNLYFPFWTFTSAPSYVPTSLFPQQAQTSGSYGTDIWVTNAVDPPNGTAFFQSTFNLPTTQAVTFNLGVDDYAQVYVDGQPIMQYGGSGGVGGSIPNTSSTTITLSPGPHQVIVEASNNNGFGGTNPNPAGLTLNVTSGGTTLLTTSNPSEWTTTGYVTQLPAGWFSGAIGNWAWTEYVMQESTSQPIYQQQAYNLTTTAAGVAATSSPVSVTWYQWQIGLTADPASLQTGQSSTLTITSMEMPADGLLTITNEQNQTIYSGPVGQAYDTTTVTSSVAATHTYTAHIMESGSDLLDSNSVSVTWTVPHQFLDNPQISGLLSDPGTPGYMWLPIPESQFENGVGPGKFWWPTFSEHGWNTEEQGGPDATQKVSTIVANSLSTGQPMSVGIYSAQARYNDPLVWARPASAFALRMVWHGPLKDWPAGGTAIWTETNPDGDYVTWTTPIRVYPATEVSASTADSEAINTFTGLLPRLVYQNGIEENQYAEPVAWGLGNTDLEASSEGAHISVTLSLQDTQGANYSQTANDVAILYSWPTWFMVGSH